MITHPQLSSLLTAGPLTQGSDGIYSIPVMSHEVDRFLASMPHGALILDVGGCWDWHWRRLAKSRPDVGVLIIDFVRASLIHAEKVLGSLVGTQVALMHADATALPFTDAGADFPGFDGVWSVQTFQHIPDFSQACHEALRVLKTGGRLENYSLHVTPSCNRYTGCLAGRTTKRGWSRTCSIWPVPMTGNRLPSLRSLVDP